MKEIKGHFEASFPAKVDDKQVKAAVRAALEKLGATGVELYVGDDQPPPQPPPPTTHP